MSQIWDNLINLKDHFIQEFEQTGIEVFEDGMDRFNQPGWVNRVWESRNYRRAHIDVVDARESKGLWMMHVCIFPHIGNDGPIFGFDVVAGKNKMTGAFHDFSPTVNSDHKMIDHFVTGAKMLDWKRERELPEWAKAIFNPDMIAAGNINNEAEINQLMFTVKNNLEYYLMNIGDYKGTSNDDLTAKAQNRYAHYQKQNPHTPRTMAALGLDEEDVKIFIEKCLFPEIEVPKPFDPRAILLDLV